MLGVFGIVSTVEENGRPSTIEEGREEEGVGGGGTKKPNWQKAKKGGKKMEYVCNKGTNIYSSFG